MSLNISFQLPTSRMMILLVKLFLLTSFSLLAQQPASTIGESGKLQLNAAVDQNRRKDRSFPLSEAFNKFPVNLYHNRKPNQTGDDLHPRISERFEENNKKVDENPNKNEQSRIDASQRAEIIEQVLKRVNEFYVFPEMAKKMEDAVRERMRKKEYDQITDGAKLAEKLTSDLQAVTRDKHLWVGYSSKPFPREQKLTAEERERMREAARRSDASLNYGFWKLERLPGNIGYMDLRQFFGPSVAGEKAAAAMNFLADTDALIIDLRNNGGGSADMVALLVSYFIEGDPILINTAYFRPGNETLESWTLKNVPGKRYLGKEVYVLTSKETFSAAEEFAYDLQNLKRAITVGETTGGGANPNMVLRINNHFEMSIPIGRVTNPITKTNWEGTGVKPDISAPVKAALKTAHLAALNKLLEKSSDEEQKATLKMFAETLQKELNELRTPAVKK